MSLNPGESTVVTFTLDEEDMACLGRYASYSLKSPVRFFVTLYIPYAPLCTHNHHNLHPMTLFGVLICMYVCLFVCLSVYLFSHAYSVEHGYSPITGPVWTVEPGNDPNPDPDPDPPVLVYDYIYPLTLHIVMYSPCGPWSKVIRTPLIIAE